MTYDTHKRTIRYLYKYLRWYAGVTTVAVLLSSSSCDQSSTANQAAAESNALSLSTVPSAVTIYPGQQGIPVTVTAGGVGSGQISVTLTGLPSGVTASPLTLTAGGSGTLTLSASRSAGQEGFYSNNNPTPSSWTAEVAVVGAMGATQVSSPLSLTISVSNPSFTPASADINLPILTINTSGIGIVDKTTEVPGTITIASADSQTSYLPNAGDTDNTATFHVHGTSTALMPKIPYHVKLNTSLDLLGTMGVHCGYLTSSGKPTCDKSKSYILLANYDDKTFLRDWSASALANSIPIGNGYLDSTAGSPSPSGTKSLIPWAPHSVFVELYLNGLYQGTYQLIEEIKVDSHKVNITELSETDSSPSAVTGGYLMEIDVREAEDFAFQTAQGVSIGLEDPDFSPEPEVPQQTSFITSYVQTAEAALFSDNFTDPKLGWRPYFDEAAAVNFYIVNEVMGNVDGGGFISSDYLYKDRNNPLIYMGPVWDFDISSGNVNYTAIVDPTVPWMQAYAQWYVQWFKDPAFKGDVVAQWNTLKKNGVLTAWLASIQQQAQKLEQSQKNNFGRWPMQGIKVWPNAEAADSYDEEVAYLINWLELRIGYLDSLFNNKPQTSTAFDTVAGSLQKGSTVTLTAHVTGGMSPTGAVSFLSNGVVLGAASIDAGGTASLSASNLPVGTDSLKALYNGDDDNALSASIPQTVMVATSLRATTMSLAVPAAEDKGSTSTAITASVAGRLGAAVPTGPVTFTVDHGSATAVILDRAGRASYTPMTLAAGTHTVFASYAGDTQYGANRASASLVKSGPPRQATKVQPVYNTINDQIVYFAGWLQQGLSYLDSLFDGEAPDSSAGGSADPAPRGTRSRTGDATSPSPL